MQPLHDLRAEIAKALADRLDESVYEILSELARGLSDDLTKTSERIDKRFAYLCCRSRHREQCIDEIDNRVLKSSEFFNAHCNIGEKRCPTAFELFFRFLYSLAEVFEGFTLPFRILGLLL